MLGKFPPRGGITTVETCAIALAMAGGRPEYLPVLIAAVEACLEAEGFDQLQATSGAPFPAVIVNGPIAKQIRLNSGFGCSARTRSTPRAPASGARCACSSRTSAARCRAWARWRSSARCATPTRYSPRTRTGCRRAGSRTREQRHGYAPGTNSVSVVFATGVTNIRRRGAKKETPEEDALNGMWRMADFMRAPNLAVLHGWEKGTPGMMMLAPIVARRMAEVGWTQDSIREFLWKNSKIPMEQLRRAGAPAWIEIDANPATRDSIKLDPWPISMKPENIVLVVAGGGHPTHSYWLQAHSPTVDGRVIRAPETFDRLLAEADSELRRGE